MAFGVRIYRDHVISRSDEVDPETGKHPYSISGVKDAFEQPMLFSQKQCIDYLRKVEPFKKTMMIDAYGYRYGQYNRKVNQFNSKEEAIITDAKGDYYAV